MSTKEETRSRADTRKKQVSKKQKTTVKSQKITTVKPKESIKLAEEKITQISKAEEEIFPEFRDLAYMYAVPKNKEMKESWAKEWADFIFKWAQFHKKLVVSISDISNSHAFRYGESRLNVDAIDEIFRFMVRKGLASWWGQEKNRIRVHWKSDDELLEDIYFWAWRSGKLMLDVYQLISAEEFWSSLPPEFLHTLLEKLVKRKRARWYDKKKTIVEIKLRDFKQE